jgi:hypothetical protein
LSRFESSFKVYLDLGIKGKRPSRSFFTLGVFIMRKIVTLSMVAGAALLVAACGGTKPAETENATVTEMNAADAMEGTTNDAMTNVDAAAGADANMAADANATAAPAADANAAAPAADANSAAAK